MVFSFLQIGHSKEHLEDFLSVEFKGIELVGSKMSAVIEYIMGFRIMSIPSLFSLRTTMSGFAHIRNDQFVYCII